MPAYWDPKDFERFLREHPELAGRFEGLEGALEGRQKAGGPETRAKAPRSGGGRGRDSYYSRAADRPAEGDFDGGSAPRRGWMGLVAALVVASAALGVLHAREVLHPASEQAASVAAQAQPQAPVPVEPAAQPAQAAAPTQVPPPAPAPASPAASQAAPAAPPPVQGTVQAEPAGGPLKLVTIVGDQPPPVDGQVVYLPPEHPGAPVKLVPVPAPERTPVDLHACQVLQLHGVAGCP